MFKGKIRQLLQEKSEDKKKLESDWQNFLKRDTYLIFDNKQQFLDAIKQITKFPRLSWFYFRARKKIKILKIELFKLNQEIEKFKGDFIRTRLKEYKSFLDGKDDKLKFGLDEDQKIAVIKDDKHNLVVAGAGSGKTSVIAAKIAYLIRRKDKINHERILALAFTRNAAKEMEERIKKNYGLTVGISTFHSLGWNIISEETKKKPNLLFDGNENDQYLLISDIFKNLLSVKEYQEILIDYLAYHPEQEVKEDSFEYKEEYYRYMRNKKYTTLNNIEVKSIGERNIANFLFLYNIEFEYEPLVEWVDKDDGEEKEYRPDFYLPDYDIYIEHWGLNEKNEVAPWFTSTSQEYLDIREWKLSQFEKHQKLLIETWDYERNKGTLISNLKNKLNARITEIEFIPIPYEELIEKVYTFKEQRNELSKLVVSFIRIAKSNYLKPEKIEKRIKSGDYSKKQTVFGKLALEVYKRYQEFLRVEDKIDFNDMINLAVKHVKQNEEKYLNRYDYILIDEFQDISYQRMKLIRRFVNQKSNTKLFCVGDDWQSIYQFTGSDVRFFINFQEFFPNPEITLLERNYRSSDLIVKLSNDLISKNKKQIKKTVYTKNLEGQNPLFFELGKNITYNRAQIPNYYRLIQTLISNGVKPSEIMVISRFKKALRDLVQYCGANEIPTEHKAGGIRFYTAHSSKGTESPHVIIMNANSGMYGFPCEIQDSSIMELAKRLVTESFFEEERRLFYVALTRSKKFIYLFSFENQNSMFMREINPYLLKFYLDTTERWNNLLPEIISNYIKEIDLERPIVCPRCNRFLIGRTGTYGRFLGCTGWPECMYTYNLENIDEYLPKPEITQTEKEKVELMNDPRYSHLFSDIGLPSTEPVQYSLKSRKGVFIKDIYFDFETKKAVKFRRTKDSKILWVPKQFLKKKFIKDKEKPQDIQLKFKPKDLYWK